MTGHDENLRPFSRPFVSFWKRCEAEAEDWVLASGQEWDVGVSGR